MVKENFADSWYVNMTTEGIHDSLNGRLDGGGVRGISSLLILRALMIEIATLEQANSQARSSVHPLQPRLRRPVRMQQARADTIRKDGSPEQTQGPVFGPVHASSFFIPAHYFDYIAGTSTGG